MAVGQMSVKFVNHLDPEQSTDILRVDSMIPINGLSSLLNVVLSRNGHYFLYLNGERISDRPAASLESVMMAQRLGEEDVLEIRYVDEESVAPERTLSCRDHVTSLASLGDRLIYMTYLGEVYEVGRDEPLVDPFSHGRILGIAAGDELYVFTESRVMDEREKVVFEASQIRCCSARDSQIALGCQEGVYLVDVKTGEAKLIDDKKNSAQPDRCYRAMQIGEGSVTWIEGYDTCVIWRPEGRMEFKPGLGLTALKTSGDAVVALTANNKIMRIDVKNRKTDVFDTPFRCLGVLQLDGTTVICGSQSYILYKRYDSEENVMVDGRILPIKGQISDILLCGESLHVAHDSWISTFKRG